MAAVGCVAVEYKNLLYRFLFPKYLRKFIQIDISMFHIHGNGNICYVITATIDYTNV